MLKNNVNASVKKIGKLFTKFVEINNGMDELMLQMSILKQENKAIRQVQITANKEAKIDTEIIEGNQGVFDKGD